MSFTIRGTKVAYFSLVHVGSGTYCLRSLSFSPCTCGFLLNNSVWPFNYGLERIHRLASCVFHALC